MTAHGNRFESGQNKIPISFISAIRRNIVGSNQHLSSSLYPSELHAHRDAHRDQGIAKYYGFHDARQDIQLGTFSCFQWSNTRELPFSRSTSLFVKKNKKNTAAKSKTSKKISSSTKKSSSSPPLKNGKIQVKLLKYVPGTGSIGDVILVAPAFYQNKLLKTNSAKVITDEEVKAEKLKRDVDQTECRNAAKDMASLLEKEEESVLKFVKKAGPNGQLFGGIRAKDVLQTLKSKYPKGNPLEGKNVKVISMKNMDGKDVEHGDIKSIGDFKVKISILSGIDAEITVSVQAE